MSEILTRWQDPTIKELKNQLQQKENIIKEVREYITSQKIIFKDYDIVVDNQLKNILEILDKEIK